MSGPIPRRAFTPALQCLEDRQLLAAIAPAAPTDAEQYMLFLINRARANPPAEAQRLLALAQSDPNLARGLGTINVSQFLQQMASMSPLPPLAFNPRLIEAARDHNGVMLQNNNQIHSPPGFLTDPSEGIANDGQVFFPTGNSAWTTGENVFAYSQAVTQPDLKAYIDYLYAGLMFDWGVPSAAHRDNLLAPGVGELASSGHVPFDQVGIGVLSGAHPTTPPPSGPANQGLNVGPVIVTQEFGWVAGTQFLTGIVYHDNNNSGGYLPGEGVGGVTITAVGSAGEGVYQTVTWQSGGYSLELPRGLYSVYANGPLPATQTASVFIGADNVEWDVRLPGIPQPVLSAHPVATAVSVPNVPIPRGWKPQVSRRFSPRRTVREKRAIANPVTRVRIAHKRD
jgi:hypothetical protein